VNIYVHLRASPERMSLVIRLSWGLFILGCGEAGIQAIRDGLIIPGIPKSLRQA